MTALKPIPSLPGYLAGEDGNIYSTLRGDPRPLRPGRQTNGYLIVNPRRPDGTFRMARVHRLVCEAWHGPCPDGMECSHLDDNKDNNTPSNLRWEPRLTNQRRRRGNGIDDAGHRNSRAALSQEQIHEVRALLIQSTQTPRQRRRAAGLTHQQIADRYGVSRLTITKVNTGDRYPR